MHVNNFYVKAKKKLNDFLTQKINWQAAGSVIDVQQPS
jgi:hypothetical protein